MSSFKVYTRTGDGGEASLYNGERRCKGDAVFAALGDVDELNSACGVARELCVEDGGAEGENVAEQLKSIQSRLLDVGSVVATPRDRSSQRKLQRVTFAAGHAAELESWIDAMDLSLPQLKNFILPSGGKPAAFLHMARAICRRAERSVVEVDRAGADGAEGGNVGPEVLAYLNRLSDYLFTAGRYMAARMGRVETIYQKAMS
ncbi:unnamed protein product [Pedinophyceae sp. YPF-701]|nr:unnamed protein product [Pedinophyceae sp. YPF-701]